VVSLNAKQSSMNMYVDNRLLGASDEGRTFGTLLVLATLDGGRGASGLCGISSSGATSGFRAKMLSRSI